MAEAIAFAPPRAEDMTKVIAGIGGAGITGVVEGVVIKMAPQVGALAPILTWGTLLGLPLMGVGGALFTRGMIGDLFQGVAAGGTAILGYSLPEMLMPEVLGRRNLNPAAGAIKQLPAGPLGAPLRAQAAAAKVGIEF